MQNFAEYSLTLQQKKNLKNLQILDTYVNFLKNPTDRKIKEFFQSIEHDEINDISKN